MPVVLCYGDSNTHGTLPLTRLGQFDRHPPGDRWPDAMAEALGPGVTVITEGLPGRTTVHDDPVEGGCRNGIAVLPAILHSHRPIDLLVVMLGTNDLKHRFSVTAFEIARSVERICALARAEGVVADLMILAPVPVREAGILALPGTMFTPDSDPSGKRQFRIAFANVDRAGIATLFTRLAALDWPLATPTDAA